VQEKPSQCAEGDVGFAHIGNIESSQALRSHADDLNMTRLGKLSQLLELNVVESHRKEIDVCHLVRNPSPRIYGGYQ
jgi:hypothetical protein